MQTRIERTKILDPTNFFKSPAPIKTIDPVPYLNQFGVIGPDETLNTDTLSQILFAAYLNHLDKVYSIEEQLYVDEYHERIFNLVENLREHTTVDIQIVLEHLYEANPYVLDLVIMTWCLPRHSIYLSEQIHRDRYHMLISSYNHKLISIVTSKAIMQFCAEAMAKTNFVPVHCLDLMWYYMDPYEIEFKFTSGITSKWVGVLVDEHQSVESMYTVMTINLEYILGCGLGRVPNPKNRTLEDLLITLLTNPQYVDSVKSSTYGKIFLNQYQKIKQTPNRYFSREVMLI
jgi:hypothetical protein